MGGTECQLHGQMEIDNNLIENAVRPLAIGRITFLPDPIRPRKWQQRCIPLWLVARKNNINEFEWMKDVFERIQGINHKDLHQLLPSNWKQHRSKPIPGNS